MKNLIRKILKESNEEKLFKFYNTIASKIKPPYFKNLEHFAVEKNEIEAILTLIFKQPIKIKDKQIFNEKGNRIYSESPSGDWHKFEYDERGNEIYFEESDGYWIKFEYDESGNLIYREDSNGFRAKSEYNEKGNLIYSKNSNNHWEKREYDESGNLIYREDSDEGILIDKR